MPDTGGIYNQMTILSGWSNVLEAPGARTTGTGQQDYLIAGPGWDGETPEGVKLIKSPTNIVWIEGSNQYDGPKSLEAVNKVQAGYKLTPLSSWGESFAPPSNVPVNKNVDTSSTPQSQIQKMPAQEFFSKFAAMVGGPPPVEVTAAPDPAPAAAPAMASASASTQKGYKHWLIIGGGAIALILVFLASR